MKVKGREKIGVDEKGGQGASCGENHQKRKFNRYVNFRGFCTDPLPNQDRIWREGWIHSVLFLAKIHLDP